MKIKNETKVGILATVAIAILVLGYSFLKGNDVFTSENTFFAVYDRVDGLTVSKPVYVNGYQIGRVSGLTLQPDGTILTEFKIDKKYELPENTIARIASTDLLGGKAIVFDLGDSKAYAISGATLQSDVQKNIMEQVEPIQKKAEALFAVLDSVLTSVNNTISPDFQKNINRSLQSIANTLNTLENTAIQVDGMVGTQKSKISGILTNMESISANFSNNNEKLTQIFTNLETVSDKAARLNFEETMNKANLAVSDLQLAVDNINNGKGSLGKLLNDDELYHNLEDASKSLDNLIIDVKENPKRYVHFSIFGRKAN
ncbi:MlaD family protein [Albibacterium sp.]|uniref:MlaD family protein n=1 Tax=Albibacterium sp. TaxID=2952885 RepID=UPI002D04E559|nr:MlaD family protein [Albibacterium sp.]HUH18868.1 MlaD family protein [Albibacterium sp.]